MTNAANGAFEKGMAGPLKMTAINTASAEILQALLGRQRIK